MESVLTDLAQCCGCTACANACPVRAISMEEDAKGFLYSSIDSTACIDCGACQNVCPVRHPESGNHIKPDYYALSMEEAVLKKSSSGGAFTLFAEEAFRREGLVYGVAWKDDFSAETVGIDREEELDRLRFSKYIQSDKRDVYPQIQKALEKGQFVLFTGTPCEVAGLRRYLRKPYENLLLVDLLCHGVPSHRMLQDYLSEKGDLDSISTICFRDQDGWGSRLDIFYQDGTIYHGTNATDPFMKGFLSNLTLRPSCSTCVFARLPRQGDLTIGDLWGASSLSLSIPWKKGVNVVLANNLKGEAFLEKAVSASVHTPHLAALDGSKGMNSNIFVPNGKNPAPEGYFAKHYPDAPFSQSVARTLHPYDIGLVQYVSNNYGSMTTSLGICSLFQSLGKRVLALDSLRAISAEPKRVLSQFVDLSSAFLSKGDTKSVNELVDTFVVGSDMSWNWGSYYEFLYSDTMFLGFAEPVKKCISIAPSMGIEKYHMAEEYRFLLTQYLRNIDYISVREESSVRVCQKLFDTNPFLLMDPIFLCPPERFLEMADKAEEKEEGFLFAYILNPNEAKRKALQEWQQREGKRLIVVLDRESSFTQNKKKMNLDAFVVDPPSFEQWLYWSTHADGIMTDSFHGACLATLFHIPFAAVHNRAKGRFETLAHWMGTDRPFYTDAAQLSQVADPVVAVDWASVDQHLAVEREKSWEWVKGALAGPLKKRPVQTNRILHQVHTLQLREWTKEREEERVRGYANHRTAALNQALQQGKTKLTALLEQESLRLSEASLKRKASLEAITDLSLYFETLRKHPYCLIIAAEDECSVYFQAFCARAGLKGNLPKPSWRDALLMMMDSQSIFYAATQKGSPLHYSGSLSPSHSWQLEGNPISPPVQVSLVSMGFRSEWMGASMSQIMVNNVDYSCRGRGINAAVLDEEGAVVDIWNVDTCGDPSLTLRRKQPFQ